MGRGLRPRAWALPKAPLPELRVLPVPPVLPDVVLVVVVVVVVAECPDPLWEEAVVVVLGAGGGEEVDVKLGAGHDGDLRTRFYL